MKPNSYHLFITSILRSLGTKPSLDNIPSLNPFQCLYSFCRNMTLYICWCEVFARSTMSSCSINNGMRQVNIWCCLMNSFTGILWQINFQTISIITFLEPSAKSHPPLFDFQCFFDRTKQTYVLNFVLKNEQWLITGVTNYYYDIGLHGV